MSGLESIGGGIGNETLLRLISAAGEEDELAQVGLKSVDVQVKLLLAGAGSSVIYGNSDGSGVSGSELDGFQFLESETAAKTNLTSILASSLGNNRTERVGRSWESASGLVLSDLMSLLFLGGLVEVSLNTNSFPVLAKMHVDNHVVMLDHC